ncbi:MAG TPA: serine/threonine-protein kinase, partial [Thermoanaerobaculia bacterium]|nr:serine/threonine-protein kinase [Thermoanaerobaculia bacterium]
MAAVYVAHDLRHNAPVVFKVLYPQVAATIGAERFLQKTRVISKLQHPNLLPLIDSGVLAGRDDDDLLWYATPRISGETIRHRLGWELQLGVNDAIDVARQLADALEYAHRRDVAHGDIKSESVTVSRGQVFLGDLGIAEAAREDAPDAPPFEKADDVYALASLLYEMLAGVPPAAASPTESVPPIHRLRDNVPPQVDEALARALSTDADDRFDTPAAFAAALSSDGVAPVMASPRREWFVWRPSLVFGIGGALLGLLAIFLFVRRPRHPAAP